MAPKTQFSQMNKLGLICITAALLLFGAHQGLEPLKSALGKYTTQFDQPKVPILSIFLYESPTTSHLTSNPNVQALQPQ